MREFLAVLSRPQTFTAPIAAELLAQQVRAFANRFTVADEFASVTDELLALVEHIPLGGRQVHDANIVATMRTYDVRRLLTNNPDDFTRYAHLITVIPLVPASAGPVT